MILKTTLLDTIANSIGYTVKKKSGYYMVVRPDCLTGRQCDTLLDVAECLASLIKYRHNKMEEKYFGLIKNSKRSLKELVRDQLS